MSQPKEVKMDTEGPKPDGEPITSLDFYHVATEALLIHGTHESDAKSLRGEIDVTIQDGSKLPARYRLNDYYSTASKHFDTRYSSYEPTETDRLLEERQNILRISFHSPTSPTPLTTAPSYLMFKPDDVDRGSIFDIPIINENVKK